MEPIDTNTKYAVESYAADAESRKNGRKWCSWFRKRLILIGSGENQHLECWSRGLLPIRQLWASFFGNSSSIDFTEIALHIANKDFKNTVFNHIVDRYYQQKPQKQLDSDQQNKIIKLLSPIPLSLREVALVANWPRREMSLHARFAQLQFEYLPEQQQQEILDIIDLLGIDAHRMRMGHYITLIQQLLQADGDLMKTINFFGIEDMEVYDRYQFLKQLQQIPKETLASIMKYPTLFSIQKMGPADKAYHLKRQIEEHINFLNESVPSDQWQALAKNIAVFGQEGLELDQIKDFIEKCKTASPSLIECMCRYPLLFSLGNKKTASENYEDWCHSLHFAKQCNDTKLLIDEIQQMPLEERDDVIKDSLLFDEFRVPFILLFPNGEEGRKLFFKTIRGIPSQNKRRVVITHAKSFGVTPATLTFDRSLFQKIYEIVRRGKDHIISLAAASFPISVMGPIAKEDLLDALQSLPYEDRESVVNNAVKLIPIVEKTTRYMGNIIRAIHQIPKEERDGISTAVLTSGIGERSITHLDEFLSIMRGIPKEDRELVITSAKSFMTFHDVPWWIVKNLFRAIAAISQEERESSFAYCKMLAKRIISGQIRLNEMDQKVIVFSLLDALQVIPCEYLENLQNHSGRSWLDTIWSGPYHWNNMNNLLYDYLVPPELLKQGRYSEFKDAVAISLEQKLASSETPPYALRRLAYFVYDHREVLGLHVAEHPLLQQAIEIIVAETVAGERNAFSLFKKLKEFSKVPLDIIPPTITVQGAETAFCIKQLQVSGKAFTVSRSEVPQDATLGAWNQLINALNQKVRANPQAREQLQTEFGVTWEILWGDVFSSPYLSGLLSLSNNPVNFVEAQFRMILHHLLAQDCQVKEGSFYSEQDDVLIKTAMSVRACFGGKREGICIAYQLLPPRYRYPAKGLKANSPEELMAREFLATVVQKCIADQFSGANAFMKELMGSDVIEQVAHQTIYVKNLIGQLVGLTHEVSFDWYTGLLYDTLLAKSREEVVQLFFRHMTPAVLVKELMRAVNSNFKENLNILRHIVDEGMEEGWDWNEETFVPICLNERGALQILQKVGYLTSSLYS